MTSTSDRSSTCPDRDHRAGLPGRVGPAAVAAGVADPSPRSGRGRPERGLRPGVGPLAGRRGAGQPRRLAVRHRLPPRRRAAQGRGHRRAQGAAARGPARLGATRRCPEELADDRLQLILLCCHPALPRESRSALALRLVIGTPTEQIARLFLVPPATMAARLTRAKKKIVLAGIPIGAPLEDELRARLDEVCRTIYLAFTAGYTPGAGPDLLRADLAGDAVRLAAVLHDLVPDAAQVRATLALLLLQHSRRDARQRDGRLVTLADQDRSLWHHDEIRAGLALAAGLRPARDTPRSSGSRPSSRPSTRGHPPPRQRTGPRSPGTTPPSKREPVPRSCDSTERSRSPRPRVPGPASPSSRDSTMSCPTTTGSPPSAPSSPDAPATSNSPGPPTAGRSTCAPTRSNGPT